MPVDLSMTGLRGIAAGQDTLNQIQARKINDLAMQKTQLDIDQQVQDQQLDQQVAQALQKLASGDAQPDAGQLFKGAGDSAAAPLQVVGETFLKGGSIKRGVDALQAAQQIRKSEADIEKGKTDAAQTKVETVMKTANAVAQTVGVARNQSEWKYGLAQLRKAQILPPEQLDQLEQMDYDPDVVAYLNDQAMTAYQKAQLDLTSARDRNSKNASQQRIDNAKNLTRIAEARLKLAQDIADKEKKNGKGAYAPNTDAIKGATSAIINQVFEGKTPTDADSKAALQAGALSVASRAQALIRENPSLDYDTALNRAIIESQVSGDWETDKSILNKVTGGVLGDEITKASYGKGKTPQTALVLPQTKEGKPDPKALVKGKFYITSKGKARWNGSAFELVSE